MPECFKDDSESQWKSIKDLATAVSKTHKPTVTKFGMGDKVGDSYPYAKIYYDPIRGFGSLPHPVSARSGAYKVTRLVFSVLPTAYSQDPCNDFHDQYVKWRLSHKEVPFGGPKNKILHFDPIFPRKKMQILANYRRDIENFAPKRP